MTPSEARRVRFRALGPYRSGDMADDGARSGQRTAVRSETGSPCRVRTGATALVPDGAEREALAP